MVAAQQDMGEEIQKIPKPPSWQRRVTEIRTKWSVLRKTPKGIPQVRLSWNLTQNVNGTKGAKRRIGEKLRGDQQIILLSLRREEEILNLRKHDLNLTKERHEAVIKEAKAWSASGIIHVVRKTASTETTVPRKGLGSRMGGHSPGGNPYPLREEG